MRRHPGPRLASAHLCVVILDALIYGAWGLRGAKESARSLKRQAARLVELQSRLCDLYAERSRAAYALVAGTDAQTQERAGKDTTRDEAPEPTRKARRNFASGRIDLTGVAV